MSQTMRASLRLEGEGVDILVRGSLSDAEEFAAEYTAPRGAVALAESFGAASSEEVVIVEPGEPVVDEGRREWWLTLKARRGRLADYDELELLLALEESLVELGVTLEDETNY